MKKIISFIALIFISHFSFAQFIECDAPTDQDLWDICFVDENLGVAVGDSGTILRSIDGGLNWEQVMYSDSIWLKKVKFFDAQNGIALGSHVLKTIDGGITWAVQNLANDLYYDIEILNDSTCIISGYPTALYKSYDRGTSWNILVNNNPDEVFGFLSFVNENIGYSCRGSASGPVYNIMKTLDGGMSWTTFEVQSGIGNTLIEDLCFVDENTGFKCGWYESHLTKTTNSGIDWEYVNFTDSLFDGQLRDLYITQDQPNAYYACGWYGTVFKSTDGGNTWSQVITGFSMETEIFYGIYFYDDKIGWVVGSNGIILKTNNGGGPVGIKNEKEITTLSLYPNPGSGLLNISNPDGLKINKISIMNSSGVVILETKSTDLIQLKNLTSGIYFVLITTPEGSFSRKIVIQ